MNIVFKNSLKNIFGKPLRTLLVVFAIFVCSLCALLCFDLSESITGILTLFYGSVSRADFIVSSSGSDVSTLPDGFPAIRRCSTRRSTASTAMSLQIL